MGEEPTKRCFDCGKDLPATEEYFYPSYLRDKGRNQCKTCHTNAKNMRASVSFRDRLREIAQFVEQEEVPSYRSLNSIAKNMGWSVAKVERDVYENQLPVFRFIYNNVGPALALKLEDADAYIATHRLNGHSQEAISQIEAEQQINTGPQGEIEPQIEAEPQVAGTPDKCACCGTTKGNILTVLDEKKEVRAYLCSACYRTASSYKWEPDRMRRMAALIESIGIQHFTV